MENLKCCIDRTTRPAHEDGLAVMHAWGLSEGWLNQNEVIVYCHGAGFDDRHKLEWLDVFAEVEEFTNLKFAETKDWNAALLRIEYRNAGSWSFVGNDNYHIDKANPTTNIGWLGRGTKRHELGHFIGLGHEHQTPKVPINWNKEYVYNYMAGAPNFWSKPQTDWNFFRVYDQSQTVGTVRDPDSIMMYAIPKEFTLDGFFTTENENWSELDKEFLSGVYPKAKEVEGVELDTLSLIHI